MAIVLPCGLLAVLLNYEVSKDFNILVASSSYLLSVQLTVLSWQVISFKNHSFVFDSFILRFINVQTCQFALPIFL